MIVANVDVRQWIQVAQSNGGERQACVTLFSDHRVDAFVEKLDEKVCH